MSALWLSVGVDQQKFVYFNTIKKHFLSFGFSVISPMNMLNQEDIIKNESLSLSGDHTYKFVKNLTVTEDSKAKVNNKKYFFTFFLSD